MKKFLLILAIVLLAINQSYAALVKSVGVLDDWSTIPQNTLLVGATADVSANYQTLIAIDAIQTSKTLTTNGLKIIVQGSSTTSGDNNWYPIATFSMCAGTTSTLMTLTNNPAAIGTTVFTGTPAGFAGGLQIGIKDGTLANNELRIVKSATANVSLTIETASTYAHISTTPIYNLAVSQIVNVPDSANRIKVIYDNTQDSAGSTFDVRTNTLKITGI